MESIPVVFANRTPTSHQPSPMSMRMVLTTCIVGTRRRVQTSHEAAATQGGEPPGTAHEVHGERRRQGVAPPPPYQQHDNGGYLLFTHQAPPYEHQFSSDQPFAFAFGNGGCRSRLASRTAPATRRRCSSWAAVHPLALCIGISVIVLLAAPLQGRGLIPNSRAPPVR
jgi:hypothetical protein